MDATALRMAGLGLGFVLIFVSGFSLTRFGKPFNGIVLTAHKLISLAAAILLGVAIYRVNQAGQLGTAEVAAVALTGLFFLGTGVTGGLSSIDKPVPLVVLVHKVAPFLTALATATTLYLLLIAG